MTKSECQWLFGYKDSGYEDSGGAGCDTPWNNSGSTDLIECDEADNSEMFDQDTCPECRLAENTLWSDVRSPYDENGDILSEGLSVNPDEDTSFDKSGERIS